jgi:hypothetical protein
MKSNLETFASSAIFEKVLNGCLPGETESVLRTDSFVQPSLQ